MRKKGMVWFSLLLLLISFLPNFFQAYIAYAQSPEEVKQTIIQSDHLNVSTTSRQVNDELLWEIDYSIGVPAENHARRIKIKVFNQDERDVIQPEQLSGWVTSQDNWFQTEALSQTGKGTVTIRTALDVSALQLKVQVDEEVTNEVEVAGETPEAATTVSQEKVLTENILVAPFADSHTLSAPIVQASTDTTVETSPVETTEVDSSDTEAETSEESTSTTESSKTESSPSESNTGNKETATTSEDVAPQINRSRYIQSAPGFIGPLSVEALADTGTPFSYTTNSTGTFPTHGTNTYLPGGATDTNANIKNFDFGTNVPGGTVPSIEHILGQNNFNDGYHSYQFGEGLTDVLMKKTVKPTADPTKFDIELDVIGGTNRTTNNIDVVFVVDKSGSMTSNNRWTNLKTELARFSKDLMEASFEPGNIKMGLVTFGDNTRTSGGNTIYTPYARMADFGNSGSQTTTITGFTEDYKKLDGNNSATRHSLLAEDPLGGTALFLGIDAGIELLKNASYGARSDARKVLIVLSDGVATYAPSGSYTSQAHFQGLTKSKVNNNQSLQFSTTRNNGGTGSGVQFVGNGQENDSNLLSGNGRSNVINLTNAFIENRRPNSSTILPIFPISIGFGLTGTYSSQAKGILRNFAGSSTTDPNSNFYDAAVDDLGEALDKIKTLILTLNDVIRNGNIIDPMSEYVSLIGGTLKSYALSLNTATKNLTSILTTASNAPQYSKNAIVDQTTNPIKVSNLYLGGRDDIRDGYRLTYTVQLKEQYQDGLFYPANKRTIVTADNILDPLDFAIPSVRHSQTVNIPVEKIWSDDNNDWSTRKDITLKLQRQNGSNWEDVTNGSFAIAKEATGNQLKHTFSNLPAYASGQAINYRVIETPTRVNGYDPGIPTPVSINAQTGIQTLKMTNNLKKIPLGKFTKINQNGDKLTGVKFQLFKADGATTIGTEKTSNANGEVDFSDIQLPVGTYILKETHTLPGYEAMPDKTITITDTGTTSANLVLTGLDDLPNEPGNQVVNHLRLFTIKVTKEDNRGNALEGATFTLKRTLPTPETTITGTTAQNIFTYIGLSAGTYILTETSPPNGYIGADPVTIVIGANGQVTIDNVAYTPTTTEGETLIQLTVKNRQKGQLPSTGGQGTQQFLIATLVLVSLAGVIGIYYVYRNRKGGRVR